MVPALMTKARVLLEAITMYQDAIISLGQAAEIAGLPYDSMIVEMRRLGIPLRFGPSSVKEAEEEARQFLESLKQSSSS
jgi:predicted HTH domain antitoxin